MNDFLSRCGITPREQAQAEACRKFEALTPIRQLREDLHEGMITSLEFSNAVQAYWDSFKRQPENCWLFGDED